MPGQDKPDDAKPATKRSNYHYYLDIRSDGQGVGPHTPGSINSWLEDRRILPDVPVRRIDQDNWVKLSEIKRFSNFLEKIAKLPPRKFVKDHWEDDPVTEKQLKRLGSFDLPIPQTLTKGAASRLISFYIHVDPEREEQYQNQPVEEEKRTKLRELIKQLPSAERTDYPIAASLTKGEATDAMDEIETRLADLEYEKAELNAELESKKWDEEAELTCIDNHYNNDEEVREEFGYKRLTKKHLKLFFAAEITEEIRNDVRRRLLFGGNLAPRGCDRARAKLALLLVLEINPYQCLTRSEAALVYGISEDKFRNGLTSPHGRQRPRRFKARGCVARGLTCCCQRRCHQSIDVGDADLPGIAVTDIDPYIIVALGVDRRYTPLRDRAYFVADRLHLKKLV